MGRRPKRIIRIKLTSRLLPLFPAKARPGASAPVTVLYDEDCAFCKATLAALLLCDRERRLRPVAIQSREGDLLLAELPGSERLRSAHAIADDGRVRSAGASVPIVLAALPGARALAWLAGRLSPATDLSYRALVVARPLLGRRIPAHVRRSSERVIAERTRGAG